MPSVAELQGLTYSGPSPSMTADDFINQLHGPLGKQVRVFQAIENIPGQSKKKFSYEELDLDDDVRVLIHAVGRDAKAFDFGLIEQGIVQISNDVRAVEFARRDRIVVTDVSWVARQIVVRGSGDTDTLARSYLASIEAVKVDGETAVASTYEVATTGIKWLSDAPATGTQYSVRYRYHPLIEYLLQGDFTMQAGGDGVLLPQRGFGRVVLPHED